jgi:rRNA pseudouridine-1189 N-methylase Emg1 (Nep1/Mra1 family)
MKDFLEFNEYECTTYSNLWDMMKAVLRKKLIALSSPKKKLGRVYTSNLTTYLKSLKNKKSKYIQEE